MYTPAERQVLIALAAGYLERGVRHDPNPRTYEEAGKALGIEGSTARKRIEHLRDRLETRGILIASGTEAKRTLIDWAIDSGVVRVADRDFLSSFRKRPVTES